MELVGSVAERMGLYGDENLAQLLDVFRRTGRVLRTDLFQGTQEQEDSAGGVTESQTRIRRAIQGLVRDVPLPSQTKDIKCALRSLAADYIDLEFGMKYDRISSGLFRLEQKITYMQKRSYAPEEETEIAIPLFACARLGSSVWKLRDVRVLNRRQEAYKTNVSAKVPPVTRKVKEKARQARADYMEICSKGLREDSVGEILFRDIQTGVARLDLQVCWIPSLSELRVEIEEIDKDPLLIANIYDRHFLVAKWDVQGEEPFEHYVREFTEKKA